MQIEEEKKNKTSEMVQQINENPISFTLPVLADLLLNSFAFHEFLCLTFIYSDENYRMK